MSSTAAKKPLKGILKQPRRAAAAPDDQKDTLAEARRIAVQHATIIQQQKDIQDQIFQSFLRLLDFPLVRDIAGHVDGEGGENAKEDKPAATAADGDVNAETVANSSTTPPRYDASNPAPSDAAEFKRLVRAFQPSDYDDLIEERNIAGACGYALCPRPRKRLHGAGKWKMVNKGRADFDIVRTEELEKWCSDDCARRALYVKVQLHETAAWERIGLPDIRIELYGEDRVAAKKAEDELAADIARLRVEEEREAAGKDGSSALALERGDTKRKGKEDLADFTIREKTTIAAPVAPSKEDAGEDDDVHMLLEGHKPR